MEPSTWRLILTEPAHGDWNMAVDEAILESVGRRVVLPTLRLFSWQPPCLSLGYAQSFADVDCAATIERGWEIVRRPTGGRAILHTDELTYSVIAPLNEPLVKGSIIESYQRISQALLGALQRIGLPARADKAYPSQVGDIKNAPVCFEVPSNYEITVAGKKLVGSAQARRIGGVLQHGSLPLCGDLTRITQALKFPDENNRTIAAQRLLQRASTVEMILGKAVPWETAAAAFENAFHECLNLSLVACELTPTELQRTDELVEEKYGNPVWTQRV
jgi:lipoyl(octanoyl) transferase